MSRVRRLRWRGWWWKLPLLAMGVSVAQVLTLRFVDPPFSSFMAIRQLEAIAAGDLGYRMAHDWRDLRDISPQLALAVVAAEDRTSPATTASTSRRSSARRRTTRRWRRAPASAGPR